MANQTYGTNCASLDTRTSFASYVKEISTITGFQEPLLEACKSAICTTLWGSGNADVSGIGMMVGYVLQSTLGFIFALACAIHGNASSGQSPSKFSRLLDQGCKTFFDSAVYFVASIQISCVVILVRKDFGINGSGFGEFTMQITWTVALLTMLPLLYPMVILRKTEKERSNYRAFLFGCCLIPFFYTFVSQIDGNFGPNLVGVGAGDGGQTIITTDQLNALTLLCLNGIPILSPAEQRVLTVFGVAGSLIVLMYGPIILLWIVLTTYFPKLAKIVKEKAMHAFPQRGKDRLAIRFFIILILILTVPGFWGIFRLRSIQRLLAIATNNAYVDNEWTFGQVVAVMLFVPVFTELGFSAMQDEPTTESLSSE